MLELIVLMVIKGTSPVVLRNIVMMIVILTVLKMAHYTNGIWLSDYPNPVIVVMTLLVISLELSKEFVLLGHIPSDSDLGTPSDWRTLEQYLGTTNCNSENDGCPPAGDKLKKVDDCYSGSDCGTSGFDAPLAGLRYTDGSFNHRGVNASSWPSLPDLDDPSFAWYRGLYSGYSEVFRYSDNRALGFSVRCLKD